MTISVLMAVYAKETAANLERCLNSIWTEQSRKPDQVVLVKDGPLTSELEEVIERWHGIIGDAFCVIANEVNVGLTKSLNKGIERVTSDLIARVDSDDISVSSRFELQEKFLSEHTDIAVLGGAIQEFNGENTCLGIRTYPKEKDIPEYMAKACPLAHPSVMMRTSLFREGGLSYNEKYRVSQDIALWYDVVKAGYKITNIDDVLVLFERNDSVFKRRSRKKAKGEFEIYMKGIYNLHGLFTFKYIYPIFRLCFRLMPVWIIKRMYGSSTRTKFLHKK